MLGRIRARHAFFGVLVATACGSSVPSSDDPEIVPVPPDAGDVDAAPDVASPDLDATIDGGADARSDADAGVGPDADVATDAGDAGAPPPIVMTGAADRIMLEGVVVTPDTSFVGEVLVEGSLITCVAPGTACAAQPGAVGATVITTNGIIAPGLIDTHNHILFDIFDDSDWLPAQAYTNHNQWPNEARYQAMLDVKQCLEDASQGKPAWCPATYDGAGSLKCEMDKWGELKGLIAGTTSIVGLAGTTSACFGSVARTVDAAQNDLGVDHVQTSALFPPSKSSADGVCTNFTSGKTKAYLIHVGEGTDQDALDEWTKLGTVTTTSSCLYAPQTTITHGTAFTATELTAMANAGMKLTWSPKSNVALYGATTNIPAALDANVLVALAPDWSMGGSQNLLDEMRFAASWDDAHFGDRLSAKDIVLMTTKNAASVLAYGDKIGTIAPGYLADLVVFSPQGADPYASILAARPKDVRMTMIGGQILYGDSVLLAAAPLTTCELLDVCGAPKFVCIAENTTDNKLGQTMAEIKSKLEAALTDVDAVTAGDGYDFAPLAPLVKCP